jgi:pyruvate,water dikinase
MWDLDRSHYPGGTTPISQWLMEGCADGMRRSFAEFGMPAETLEVRFVHGFMYTRLRPLIAGDRVMKRQPPRLLLKAGVRLHPAMRRRARQAAASLANRPWRKVVEEWASTIRPRLEHDNAAWQEIDPITLDDAALGVHVEKLLGYLRNNFELHFYLHTFDLGPIGLLLQACEGWGIAPAEVIPALSGASPSTSAPARALAELRELILAHGSRPADLDEVQAVSPEAAHLLAEYLGCRGRMMVTRYDIDGHTLDEEPDVVLATILDGKAPSTEAEQAVALGNAARERVPPDQRAIFDERLAEARAAMDLRDDNGPNTVELPVGILRHSLLEVGRRLAARGRLNQPEHVLELRADEVAPLLRNAPNPTAAEVGARADSRQRMAALIPPSRLGPEESPPPLEVLAPAHQVMVGAVTSVLVHLGMAADARTEPLKGCGVGTTAYRGRARVALNPEQAIDAMDPGDVLVVRFTTPAYNTVLTLAGAIVTAEGALLSHAAVMARELNIPAVVGASGALQEIADGDEIEVDPVSGLVRITRSGPSPNTALHT